MREIKIYSGMYYMDILKIEIHSHTVYDNF